MEACPEPEPRLQSRGEEEKDAAAPPRTSPWNIMIKHRQVQRRGRRSQVAVSFTDPAISMDLLRAVLQPCINEEIQNVFNKYMKFFQKAAINVRENVGDHVDPEQLIRDTCCNCLEQAKALFSNKAATKPAYEVSALKRQKQMDDDSNLIRSQAHKKKKGRLTGQNVYSERHSLGLPLVKPKAVDIIRREGPKKNRMDL